MARFTNGWVKIHRSLLNDRYDGVDIGLLTWLIMAANYQDGKSKAGSKSGRIEVKRGQVVTSICEIANELKWDRRTIRKRLKIFQNEGIISAKIDNHGCIITICNYDSYQSVDDDPCTAQRTALCTTPCTTPCTAPCTHNKEYKELKETKEGEETRGRARRIPQEQVDQFLDAYFDEIEKHYGKRLLKTSILSDLASRIIAEVGLDRSIALAAAFCASNRKYYISRAHSLDVMLADLSQLDAFA